MTLQGFGGPPQYLRIAVTDYYTAALACQAILAGLFARERTGRGQRVETSLLHGALALQSGNVVEYAGKPTRASARRRPTACTRRATGSGSSSPCGNQAFWAKLCTALGRQELARRPALRLVARAHRPRRRARRPCWRSVL